MIKLKLITLSQGTEFLKQTGERGFLNIDKESFIASIDWWALVYDDIGMPPGSYIFNQEDKYYRKIRHWQFISSDEERIGIVKEIGKKIDLTFHPDFYFLADFERREKFYKDIMLIRKADFWGRNFDPAKQLLYHLIIPETKAREAVNSETLEFLYRRLREKGGRFWMKKDLNKHYPIILGDNENFDISSGSPWAIIMPICEETKDGDYSINGPGYDHIFY